MGIRSVIRRRKDNAMAKRKRTIRQITNTAKRRLQRQTKTIMQTTYIILQTLRHFV
jgi:hypothetical protein